MVWYKPQGEYPRSIILAEDEVFRFGELRDGYTLPDLTS